MKKSVLVTVAILSMGTLPVIAQAREGGERADFFREARQARSEKVQPETVNWTGLVKCKEGSHVKPHDCDLEFVRQDGERFDIVDSDALTKEHCQKNADLKVKLTGEITSQFLFWGGNLVVKDYTILEEKGQKVCDLAYANDVEARRNNLFRMESRR